MADFNVRSDSVDVEQIMEQIRARIREKRGVDYTDDQVRELARVKLEKFLDPKSVRSDLLEQYQRTQQTSPPNYAFEEDTLFESHRGLLRWIRNLLRPVLKLFFNPNPLIQALHIQSQINTMFAERENRLHLQYEVLHNLVVEMTRTGIELKNLKMRVESLASRLEFTERRARALEGVVMYKPAPEERFEPPTTKPVVLERPAREAAPAAGEAGASPAAQPPTAGGPASTAPPEGPGQRSRRRRRRRGRRGGAPAAVVMGSADAAATTTPPPQDGFEPEMDDEEGADGVEVSGDEGDMVPERGSDTEPDGRLVRPEPIEQAIADVTHPAEPIRNDQPIASDRPASNEPDDQQ